MIDDFPECPNQCGLMIPQYDNTGFEPPEGAPHYELSHYRCPICGTERGIPEEGEGDQDGE